MWRRRLPRARCGCVRRRSGRVWTRVRRATAARCGARQAGPGALAAAVEFRAAADGAASLAGTERGVVCRAAISPAGSGERCRKGAHHGACLERTGLRLLYTPTGRLPGAGGAHGHPVATVASCAALLGRGMLWSLRLRLDSLSWLGAVEGAVCTLTPATMAMASFGGSALASAGAPTLQHVAQPSFTLDPDTGMAYDVGAGGAAQPQLPPLGPLYCTEVLENGKDSSAFAVEVAADRMHAAMWDKRAAKAVPINLDPRSDVSVRNHASHSTPARSTNPRRASYTSPPPPCSFSTAQPLPRAVRKRLAEIHL
jgi:hypothetical protein